MTTATPAPPKPTDYPARGAPPSDEERARRAAVRETQEETGLVIDAADLETLSCWTPPPGIALRIRTWFFAARAPVGELTLSANEAVASVWQRPADALARHARGELTLYPPTWVTLHSMADQSPVDAVLAEIRLGGVQRFDTVSGRTDSGPMLLWQDDAQYDPDAATDAPARHRIEIGRLPWVYTCTR